MRHLKLVLGLGFLSWLIPFVVSIFAFPLKGQETPLFDNVMAAAVTGTAVLLGCRLVRARGASVGAAAAAGAVWWVLNVGCDLLMFSWGPMKMSPAAYLKDIGVAYNVYPIVLAGLAAVSRTPKSAVSPLAP